MVHGSGTGESDGGADAAPLTLFLGGDFMCARGIDQILPQPSSPELYEPCIRDARDYVALAETVNGPIVRPVDYAYVWGDALAELARRRPQLRIVNLESSITCNDRPWPKGINYRMHPANLPCLTVAALDACVLANNHVLDWQEGGLVETLAVLQAAGLRLAGAGLDLAMAQAPAVLPRPDGGRLLLFAAATDDCGVPPAWAATTGRPGVNRLPELSAATLAAVAANIAAARAPGDVVVFSLHWGGNWGFEVSSLQQRFAHGLIEAGVDLVHGHSSHHVKAIEVYRERLILYGCGDLLDDYEGISGMEAFRADLGALYLPQLDSDGRLRALALVPTRLRRLSITRADAADRRWLQDTWNREGRRFGTAVVAGDDGSFLLRW